MNIAYFLVPELKLITCTYKVVKYVPDLCLIEELVEVVTVSDLTAEDEFELVVSDLKLEGIYLSYTATTAKTGFLKDVLLWYEE